MSALNNLKVKHKIFLIVGLAIFGFLIYGSISLYTINTVKVGGSLYSDIIRDKDLLADIEPPTEYLGETHLVTLQLANAEGRKEIASLLKKHDKLKKNYYERYEHWQKDLADIPKEMELLTKSNVSVTKYFNIFDKKFRAAINQTDFVSARQIARDDLGKVYAEHRFTIDALVKVSSEEIANRESEAATRVTFETLILFGIGIFITAIFLLAGWFFSKTIVNRIQTVSARVEKLRGLCITNLGKATKALADGDLEYEIITGTEFIADPSNDELGELSKSVDGIIKQTQSTVASFEASRKIMLSFDWRNSFAQHFGKKWKYRCSW